VDFPGEGRSPALSMTWLSYPTTWLAIIVDRSRSMDEHAGSQGGIGRIRHDLRHRRER
jgi:hypothetical protein